MTFEYKRKNVWRNVSEQEHGEIYAYGEKYKMFLGAAKTEREACAEIIRTAKRSGFISMEEALSKKIQKGDKIYLNNKNKSAVLVVVGEDINDGLNVVASHIDSPRLDLKANPLYEDSELALFKTHYYGGIKKHQWTAIPLSLHGVIFDKNGKKIEIRIGDMISEPVFYVNELLVHLSADLNKKPIGSAIEGEKLHVVVGHDSFYFKDEEENPVKKSILKLLNDKYGIEEEDFQTAELELVPAENPRDVGFDKAMIASHGHDDRVCSFAALDAITNVENPKRTAVVIFADKEEIGSVGNTGLESAFFDNAIAEILDNMEEYSEIKLRRILAKSKVLSGDVTVAVDPLYKDATEEQNAAISGCGIAVTKFTGARGKSGSNDANSEFLNEVKTMLKENNVIHQYGELGKVDQGGGGTVAYILAAKGAEVVDMGTPMLSMHAPIELVSKADAYMTRKAYYSFLK